VSDPVLPQPSFRGRSLITTPPSSKLTPSSVSPVGSVKSRSGRLTPEVASSASLIADVQLPRARLLLTKTHILYPPSFDLAPYQSCVLGFKVVFHSLSQTRIKDCDLTFRFLPPIGERDNAPIIKALYPSYASGSTPTDVKFNTTTSGRLSIGFDPYGSVTLKHSQYKEASFKTATNVRGSGVETSMGIFTSVEDPGSHSGVEPALELAFLLYLPSPITKSFELELSVEATVDRLSVAEKARRLLGSPRVWLCHFDGISEIGRLSVSTNLGAILPAPELPQIAAGDNT